MQTGGNEICYAVIDFLSNRGIFYIIFVVKRFLTIICAGFLFSGVYEAAAALEFEKTEYKVTSKVDEMKKTFEFSFVNKSSDTVKVKNIWLSCTCLKAWMPDENYSVAPGASGKVFIEIDLGAFGTKVEKDAEVQTSEGQKIPLLISVEVPQFVKVTPQTLKWEVGEKLTPKKMKLVIDKALDLKLEEVSISQKSFEFEAKELKAGKEYEIIVTPKATDSPEFALLRIRTNSSQPRYKTVIGYLSIDKPAPGKK